MTGSADKSLRPTRFNPVLAVLSKHVLLDKALLLGPFSTDKVLLFFSQAAKSDLRFSQVIN